MGVITGDSGSLDYGSYRDMGAYVISMHGVIF